MKWPGILKAGGIRRQHDIAQHGEFRVAQRRAVDRGDHRGLDREMVHQQMLARGEAMFPVGAGQLLTAAVGRGIGGKGIAGAGQDYHPVLGVAANLAEQE